VRQRWLKEASEETITSKIGDERRERGLCLRIQLLRIDEWNPDNSRPVYGIFDYVAKFPCLTVLTR
jgi:hypothetical protein